MRLPLILLTILSCSCSALKLPSSAPSLQTVDEFKVDETKVIATELPRVKQRLFELNAHRESYNALIREANKLFSRLDGQRRGTSRAAILAQTGMAAGGIATAALNAAAPAANAAWIQGLNATTTGTNSVRAEFATQRMTSDAYTQTLTVLANDIITARQKINFPQAYSQLLTPDNVQWTRSMTAIGTGIRDLETAIVLRPMTLTVNVVKDSRDSSDLAASDNH
jgi:hypothetical protein